MEFIGRDEDMRALEECYRRRPAFAVITGRRRVGKSTLIKEFIKDKRALYYEADDELEPAMIHSFSMAVSAALGREPAEYDSWASAMRAYVEGAGGRCVIVIDEFQYLIGTNRGVLKQFQSIWDNFLSQRDVMLILCGSYISIMRSEVLERKSPLYGRCTCDLMLYPLRFRDTVRGRPYRDAVEEYAVTGGVPYYMALMDPGETLEDNMRRLMLSRGGPLTNEGEFLLGDEFSNVRSYNTIMKTIARGNRKLSDIASAAEVKATTLTPYLHSLIKVGLVRRDVPVTEANPETSRNGLYAIDDNFMAFWFRFIYPYRNQIVRGEPSAAEAQIRMHFVEHHAAFVFERVCREEMYRALSSMGVPAECGSYWKGSLQIDVMAVDRVSRTVYAGECKFRRDPVGADVLRSLAGKCGEADLGGYDVRLCLFSVSGYTEGAVEAAASMGAVLFDRGEPLPETPLDVWAHP